VTGYGQSAIGNLELASTGQARMVPFSAIRKMSLLKKGDFPA
jgi:hypothetical protein